MKLRIDKYSFGKMTIGGKEFTSDLIIHRDGRIQDNWWRKQGHNLIPEDISIIFDSKPEKLIVGSGAFGLMKASDDVLNLCKKRGIEVEICRTPAAVTRFNEVTEAGRAVAACFHLTC